MALRVNDFNEDKRPRAKKLDPLVVHPLPVAKIFLGRESELERMMTSLEKGGVLSLVGVGGSGKTATVERFLRKLTQSDKFEALLVWSFYDDPDTNAFLRTAVEYLTGGTGRASHGSGWFQALKQAIEARPGTVLVLDGLERIQRPVTSPTGIYGELEDPLLKALLSRMASFPNGAKAIITSRFPLPDLDRLDSGYEVINVNELSSAAAAHLLADHGVSGTKPEIERLLSVFGRHALTVDLLGTAIGRFFDGDPKSVSEITIEEGKDVQAHRLKHVLQLFEKGLSQKEQDLMSRLCVFRFGVNVETLSEIFSRSEMAVGGSLTGISLPELEELAEHLCVAHLLYKEGNQYSVHPAVRDHFYTLFRESAQVHGAITQHLLSLSNRPGVGLPTSKDALDLLEELVHHALRSGRVEEAAEIYAYRLGGSDHLNTAIGEYSRTFRILQAFPECPDAGGMYHCMRAFGAFEEALKWRPQNRYIRLAQGELADLATDPSETTRTVARFLMGERVAPPDRTPDFPITAAAMLMMQGRLDDAMQKCEQEVRLSLYADDMARNKLSMADLLLRQGRQRDAAKELEEISGRILSSGSQEHLCMYYLVSGRYEMMNRNPAGAVSALAESLQLAKEAQFDLFTVDILVAQAEAFRAVHRLEHAVVVLGEAVELARTQRMRYAWGESTALAGLASALREAGDADGYAVTMRDLLDLQVRIGHPDTSQTQKAVALLG